MQNVIEAETVKAPTTADFYIVMVRYRRDAGRRSVRLTDGLAVFDKEIEMLNDTEQWEHDEQRAMEQEIEKLREKNQNLFNALMESVGKNDELHKALKEQEGYDGIAHDMEKLRFGLENCRLLAAQHRNEDWALLILGFCAEAGVVGNITR